jgi:hypothetical protein
VRTDADGLLATRFAATRDGHDDSDWGDVLRRVSMRGTMVRRWRFVLVAAAVLLAIVLPTLALSASVRGLLGLANPPSPDYRHARLAVSAPIPGGRIARVWVSPSTSGGECEFVTIDPVGSRRQPIRMTGGGGCSLGRKALHGPLVWSFSHGRRDAPLIHGRVDPKLRARRVELRWHRGTQQLAYNNGFFVAAAPALNDPPFHQLPYDVVAYDIDGRIAARSRIPTSFLYLDWKRVQPQLHQYRVAHGCDTTVVWRCRSR